MKSRSIMYYLILVGGILLLFLGSISAQRAVNFDLEPYQDPAGDVMKYNATINGEVISDIIDYESLDFKWVHCEEDGQGNVLLKMDLKSKNKFLNEDETKYVFRILTSADNSTGYNITYKNQAAIMVPFSQQGNGTSINIFPYVTFIRDRGDEIMVITISISQYLSNVSYFGIDAYSMKITNNATYLDYISELPGHPEYVDPGVEGGENLDGGGDDSGDSKGDDAGSIIPMVIIIAVIVIVLFVLAILFRTSKQRR